VDAGADSEDPAVHEQADESEEIDGAWVVVVSAGTAEVINDLVVCRFDAPYVMDHVPGKIDDGMALGCDPPVERDQGVGAEADLLVSQVAV
jgi:hypothetical protein